MATGFRPLFHGHPKFKLLVLKNCTGLGRKEISKRPRRQGWGRGVLHNCRRAGSVKMLGVDVLLVPHLVQKDSSVQKLPLILNNPLLFNIQFLLEDI